MAFRIRFARTKSEPLADAPLVRYPEWSEHIVTAVAAGVAVLVVASIAVLMGMA